MKKLLPFILILCLFTTINAQSITTETDSITFNLNQGDTTVQSIQITNNADSALILSTSYYEEILSKMLKSLNINSGMSKSGESSTDIPPKTDNTYQTNSQNKVSAQILVLSNTVANNTVLAKLDDLGHTYDSYNTINYSAYENYPQKTIIVVMNGGSPSALDFQSLENMMLAGKKVIMLGGSATGTLYTAITQNFNLTYSSTGWTTTGAPHMTITNPTHPLANGLESSINFGNNNASYYMAKLNDPEMEVISINGHGYANFIRKGNFTWFLNAANDSYWSSGNDIDVIHTVLRNAIDSDSYLTVTLENDTIPANSSLDVDVKFNAKFAFKTDYRETIQINADNGDSLLIPVIASVSIYPIMGTFVDSVQFDSLYVTNEDSIQFFVSNSGNDTLIVTNISFSGSDVTSSSESLKVNPLSTNSFFIKFSPQSAGSFDQTMTMTTNEPSKYPHQVAIYAGAYQAQELSIDESSFTLSLLEDSVATRTFNITNTGGRNLTYNLNIYEDYEGQEKSMKYLNWLGADVSSGNLDAGESRLVELTISVPEGNYYKSTDIEKNALVEINSNDPFESQEFVSVNLTSTYFAEIEVNEDSLNFDDVFVNDTVIHLLEITNNNAYDTLNITNIEFGSGLFFTDSANLMIYPMSTETLEVKFSHDEVGEFTDSIMISSNDRDIPLITLPLHVEMFEPPIIDVSETSLSFEMDSGDEDEAVFTISNSGAYPLQYSISTITDEDEIEEEGKRQRDKELLASVKTETQFGETGEFLAQLSLISKKLKKNDGSEIKVAVYPNNAGIINVINLAEDMLATGLNSYDTNILKEYDVLINIRATDYNSTVTQEFIENGGVWIGEYSSNEIPIRDWGIISGTISSSRSSGTTGLSYLQENHYLAQAVDWDNFPFGSNPAQHMSDLRGIDDNDANIIARVAHNSFPENPLLVEKRYGSGTIILFNWDYQDSPALEPMVVNLIQEVVRYGANHTGFIRYSSGSGTIEAGESKDITVTAFAKNLSDTVITGQIKINSNDPESLVEEIDISVTVNSNPNIALSSDTLSFGTTILTDTIDSLITLKISNNGDLDLIVSDIVFSGTNITVDTTTFTINAFSDMLVTLRFQSENYGDFSQTMTINSNDPNDPNLVVDIDAITLQPATISASPDNFDFEMESGDTEEVTFTVTNSGGVDLEYNILTELDTTELEKRFVPEFKNRIPLENNSIPIVNDNPIHNVEKKSHSNTARFLVAHSDIERISAIMSDAGHYSSDDFNSFDTRYNTPTLEELQGYEVVIYYGNYTPQNRTALGDVLKEYVDQGGSVFILPWGLHNSAGLLGGITEAGYSPFIAGGSSTINGTLDLSTITNNSHPIFNGIVNAPSYRGQSNYASHILNEGGILLAKDASGTNVLAINQNNNVIYFSAPPYYSSYYNDDTRLLLANILNFLANGGNFEFTGNSGLIASGESEVVTMKVKSNRLPEGISNFNLNLVSNDPVNPELSLAISIDITAVPNIASPDTVLFDTINPGVDTLYKTITVTNIGLLDLDINNISSNSDKFVVENADTLIVAGASYSFTVCFMSDESGDHEGNITISSNDPDEANAIVKVIGSAYAPPIVEMSTDELEFTLGDMMTRSKTVSFTNSGDRILNIMPSTGGYDKSANWVSVSSNNFNVDPGATVDLTITVDANDLSISTYSTYIDIYTNDPEEPYLYIQVTLNVIEYDTPTFTFDVHYSSEASLENFLKFFVYSDADVGDGDPAPIITVNGSEQITTSAVSSVDNLYQFDLEVSNGSYSFVANVTDITESVLSETISLNIQISKAKSGDMSYKVNEELSMMIPEKAYINDAYVFNQTLSDFEFLDEKKSLVSPVYQIRSSSELRDYINLNYELKSTSAFYGKSEKIGLYQYNKSTGIWEQYDGQGANNEVSADIEEHGTFAFLFDENFTALPTEYSIEQNYPNPFNPVTNIPVNVAKAAQVSINIYNVLGQKITTLVNEQLPRGRHEFTWSGLNQKGVQVASGIYYYRVQMKNKVFTKKMILIK